MSSREEVYSEIRRVAREAGVEPFALSRKVFLEESDVGYGYEKFGSWTHIRQLAAIDEGNGFHPHDPIEKIKSADELSYTRKLERQLARQTYFSDKMARLVSDYFENNPISFPDSSEYSGRGHAIKDRELVLDLSDLHFGQHVDESETLKAKFEWSVAARRMAKLAVQAAEWKPHYRDNTRLRIVLNGDIIAGVIHLTDFNIRPLTEQLVGATQILVSMIDYLRKHFADIVVVCVPGNHDRNIYKTGGSRAIAQRWDSHAHSIYYGLTMAFRHEPRVKFSVPRSGMAHWYGPGEELLVATHGDVEPTVENVGKSVNTQKLIDKLNRLQVSGVYDRPVSVLMLGHWHQPLRIMAPNGSELIVNGSLIGTDPYAQNVVGMFSSEPAQWLFESVPGYPIGDGRIVRVRDADEDDYYDTVISPPSLNLEV